MMNISIQRLNLLRSLVNVTQTLMNLLIKVQRPLEEKIQINLCQEMKKDIIQKNH
jgi:hypothetical protein